MDQISGHYPPMLLVIHPVAGTEINPPLRNAATDRLNISRIPSGQALASLTDAKVTHARVVDETKGENSVSIPIRV